MQITWQQIHNGIKHILRISSHASMEEVKILKCPLYASLTYSQDCMNLSAVCRLCVCVCVCTCVSGTHVRKHELLVFSIPQFWGMNYWAGSVCPWVLECLRAPEGGSRHFSYNRMFFYSSVLTQIEIVDRSVYVWQACCLKTPQTWPVWPLSLRPIRLRPSTTQI